MAQPSTALTFYHVPNSTSNSTSAVLAELEHLLCKPLATRITLSIDNGDTRTPLFLSTINPNGQVPTIIHDGVAIWESAAITMYLGETFGVGGGEKPALYPALGPRRGEAMKWIVWANEKLAAAGQRLSIALPADVPGADKVGERDDLLEKEKGRVEQEKAKKGIEKVLRILDGQLEGRDFLLGKEYCLADTHVWSFMSWMTIMGVTLEEFGAVKQWMARVGTRPALKDE